MVDRIKSTFKVLPAHNLVQRGPEAPPSVEGVGDEKYNFRTQKRFVERRKNKDRRRGAPEGRGVYDMRGSRGRRRTDQVFPSIETKA